MNKPCYSCLKGPKKYLAEVADPDAKPMSAVKLILLVCHQCGKIKVGK